MPQFIGLWCRGSGECRTGRGRAPPRRPDLVRLVRDGLGHWYQTQGAEIAIAGIVSAGDHRAGERAARVGDPTTVIAGATHFLSTGLPGSAELQNEEGLRSRREVEGVPGSGFVAGPQK